MFTSWPAIFKIFWQFFLLFRRWLENVPELFRTKCNFQKLQHRLVRMVCPFSPELHYTKKFSKFVIIRVYFFQEYNWTT